MTKFLSAVLVASALAVSASAQVLNDFSSFVNSSSTFFKGSWTNNAANETPLATFQQGAGSYDVLGGSTNDAFSGVQYYFMDPGFNTYTNLNVGANRSIELKAQLLSGNTATSMLVALIDINDKVASTTLDLTSVSGSSFTTLTGVLTPASGFDWSSVQGFVLSGGITGGTSAFNVRFDNLAVIPETSTYAAILGALTLGVVAVRRYRKSAA